MPFHPHFRPRAWSIVGTLILVTLFVRLGLWQLDRAALKQERHDLMAGASSAPPLTNASDLRGASDLIYWHPVDLQVTYLANVPAILLDNQVNQGQVGYDVFGVVRLADGAIFTVARGWVPAGDRTTIPSIHNPTGSIRLQGILAHPPAPGIRLGAAADVVESIGLDLLRVQRLDAPDLLARLPEPIGELIIYQATPDGGTARTVAPAEIEDGSRSRAYATQWFTFAAVTLLLFVFLNWKRRESA
ncbi:MAG: SURF1 family protein [Gammaproteobacteria bacterium]|nr:SURF1 family protein [Gammaproteobacteria bacterium]